MNSVPQLEWGKPQLKSCSVRGCGAQFHGTPEMLFCGYHAERKLEQERGRTRRKSRKKFDDDKHWVPLEGEIEIIDENGVVRWSGELAHYYRRELVQRQHREFKEDRGNQEA